jgi:uncharacterized protein YggE
LRENTRPLPPKSGYFGDFVSLFGCADSGGFQGILPYFLGESPLSRYIVGELFIQAVVYPRKRQFQQGVIMMKTRSIFIAATFILALVLGACAPAASPAQPRTLNVTGTGTAFLTPDIAYVYLGVHTEKPSAVDAVAENNTNTQAVIKALTDFGIDPKDILTTNFSINPSDKYDPQTNQPTGEKVYSVDNTVYVTVRDIKKLGDLLDTMVKAGANTVNGIQFDVANKDAALKGARADAVKDAKAKAQELADISGVQLGAVQSVSFLDNTPIPFAAEKFAAAAVQAASVPVQTGQLTFTVTVSMTYEIK